MLWEHVQGQTSCCGRWDEARELSELSRDVGQRCIPTPSFLWEEATLGLPLDLLTSRLELDL